MKKFILGTMAAIGLALVSVPDALAHWEYRTVYRWRPVLGGYVAHSTRVWVPDPVVVAPVPTAVVTPAPVFVPRPVYYRAPVAVVTPAPAPVIVPRAYYAAPPGAVIVRP